MIMSFWPLMHPPSNFFVEPSSLRGLIYASTRLMLLDLESPLFKQISDWCKFIPLQHEHEHVLVP
jgi:hypothetical protein